MKYPSLREVEKANQVQLGRWMRFLASPGFDCVGKPNFEDILAGEKLILSTIIERFERGGDWTPELSKQVGWET